MSTELSDILAKLQGDGVNATMDNISTIRVKAEVDMLIDSIKTKINLLTRHSYDIKTLAINESLDEICEVSENINSIISWIRAIGELRMIPTCENADLVRRAKLLHATYIQDNLLLERIRMKHPAGVADDPDIQIATDCPDTTDELSHEAEQNTEHDHEHENNAEHESEHEQKLEPARVKIMIKRRTVTT